MSRCSYQREVSNVQDFWRLNSGTSKEQKSGLGCLMLVHAHSHTQNMLLQSLWLWEHDVQKFPDISERSVWPISGPWHIPAQFWLSRLIWLFLKKIFGTVYKNVRCYFFPPDDSFFTSCRYHVDYYSTPYMTHSLELREVDVCVCVCEGSRESDLEPGIS